MAIVTLPAVTAATATAAVAAAAEAAVLDIPVTEGEELAAVGTMAAAVGEGATEATTMAHVSEIHGKGAEESWCKEIYQGAGESVCILHPR